MDPRQPLYVTSARHTVKPLVRLAVRVLGPGPLRLKMVKLSHGLDADVPAHRHPKAA